MYRTRTSRYQQLSVLFEFLFPFPFLSFPPSLFFSFLPLSLSLFFLSPSFSSFLPSLLFIFPSFLNSPFLPYHLPFFFLPFFFYFKSPVTDTKSNSDHFFSFLLLVVGVTLWHQGEFLVILTCKRFCFFLIQICQ